MIITYITLSIYSIAKIIVTISLAKQPIYKRNILTKEYYLINIRIVRSSILEEDISI